MQLLLGRAESIWAKEFTALCYLDQTLVPPVITMTLYFVIFGNLIGSRIGEMHGFTYNAVYCARSDHDGGHHQRLCQHSSLSFFSAKFQRNIKLLVAPVPTHVVIAGYVGGGVARVRVQGFWIYHRDIVVLRAVRCIHGAVRWADADADRGPLLWLAGLLNAVFAKQHTDISPDPHLRADAADLPRRGVLLLTCCPPFWQALSHLNPIVYMIRRLPLRFPRHQRCSADDDFG